jgi:hypothetical protein
MSHAAISTPSASPKPPAAAVPMRAGRMVRRGSQEALREMVEGRGLVAQRRPVLPYRDGSFIVGRRISGSK